MQPGPPARAVAADRDTACLLPAASHFRHRLARFEELAGARLDELATQMELWWALSWLDHAPRTAGD